MNHPRVTEQHFPLSQLPAELRNKIYLYAFGAPHFRIEALDRRHGHGYRLYSAICSDSAEMWGWIQTQKQGPLRSFKEPHPNTGILLTSRQISAEAFDDSPSLTAFVVATPDTSLAVMTNLILTLTFQPAEIISLNWIHHLSICLGKMQGLRVFQVAVWSFHLDLWNPRQRMTKCVGDYKQSAVLPRLERGLVIFTGEQPSEKREKLDTETISPLELCYEIAGLLKGSSDIQS